jgi:tetratricopeptide (TPR) repeat protein
MVIIKYSLLIAFILLFFNQTIAQINIDFERYEAFLADEKYDELIVETDSIRWSQEYGKNWWIDYYMAMGYCGKGDRQAANYAFEYIVRSYKDALDINELIFVSRNSCGNQTVPVDNRFEEIIGFVKSNWNAEGGRVSRVNGKLGYVMDCNQDVELYEFNPDFDYTELSKRLFSISEPQKAIEYYNDFLPEGKYDVEAAGRFIIITLADKDIDPLRIIKVGSELEKIYQFFVNFYSVRPPDKLITVYLMGTKSNLQQVAKDTHGLTIPKNNYGYSNIADLSILGNSSPEGIGTMAHELFHLIIRADIGDIRWMRVLPVCMKNLNGRVIN